MVDDTLRGLIHDDARESAMAEAAFESRDTLWSSGVKLAMAGETSLAEVMRVCREDAERDGGV